MKEIMDPIITSAPTNQIQIDIFKNQWRYNFPIPNTVSGKAKVSMLHSDVRFAKKHFGPLKNFRVLELGPNEGQMTIGLDREGARDIVAVECRTDLFLKCLIIKNIFKLNRVTFLLGDFVKFLSESRKEFDIILACGVLYHMTNPLELIELICRRSDRVLLASHYVNEGLLHFDASKREASKSTGLQAANWHFPNKEGEIVKYKGLEVTYFKNVYSQTKDERDRKGVGGIESYSNMMKLEDIIRAFQHFGFEVVGDISDNPDELRGARVLFAAKRKDSPRTMSNSRNEYLRVRRYVKKKVKKILFRLSFSGRTLR